MTLKRSTVKSMPEKLLPIKAIARQNCARSGLEKQNARMEKFEEVILVNAIEFAIVSSLDLVRPNKRTKKFTRGSS